MKYYAVIDTNVVVSALLKWDSVPGNILELSFQGPIIPLLNEEILAEYHDVLKRPKFAFSQEQVKTVLDRIVEVGVFIDADNLEEELPDPKDRVFYEVVMEERKTEDAYLITGNLRHFPDKPFIVTPRQMIDKILEDHLEQ